MLAETPCDHHALRKVNHELIECSHCHLQFVAGQTPLPIDLAKLLEDMEARFSEQLAILGEELDVIRDKIDEL